jgi:hypothetical protein
MRKVLFATLLLALWGSCAAKPAPWYEWRSKVDGRQTCRQVSPGEGWEKVSGPYRDARCLHPGTP